MISKRYPSILLIVFVALASVVVACGSDAEPTPAPTAAPIITAVEQEVEMGLRCVREAGVPPEMTIDPNKKYTATIQMAKGGEIVIELFPKEAPKTVNNFVCLSTEGFYDGLTFHRVIPNFMAQGGGFSAFGQVQVGYTFGDEFSPIRRHDGPGVLSMANRGPSTNSSQFFIIYVATPHLDDAHTVFGKVIEGMDVVEGITVRDPDTATTPGDAIKTIKIEESQ